MANEQKSNSTGTGGNQRGGRRRYFRRKKSSGENKSASKSVNKSGKAEQTDRSERSTRPGRTERPARTRNERRSSERNRGRRRRSRQRAEPETQTPSIVTDIEEEYVAPTSVFIYSHVIRPSQGSATYEFRSDHFSKSGRRIEDFRVDLSGIIGKVIFDEEDGDEQFLKMPFHEAFALADKEELDQEPDTHPEEETKS